MQIILIGMMYSGKTTVGQRLAKSLGKIWLDSDKVIEEKNGSIQVIFKKFGEQYFRDIEESVIANILEKNADFVLSTGGGSILRENTQRKLKNCVVIFLKTSLQELQSRMEINNIHNTQRPLAQKLEKLYLERQELYLNSANFIVDTDFKTVENVVEEIQKKLKEIVCQLH